MTCPYFDAKIIGRKSGSSAVASAAYRSGQTLFDERVEKRFDYQHRDGILYTEIVTPEEAPAWASDRSQLWNRVEAAESRKDAQLARDIIAALPRELSLEHQIRFVREFVETNFTDRGRGMVADFAIHESDAGDGGTNPHVHIMLTLRRFDGDQFSRTKAREWNDQELVTAWRDSWEELQNAYLENAGSDARVKMRSNKEQGINKEPQQHMGVDANALETKGVETRIGDHNRAVDHRNDIREVAGERSDIDPSLLEPIGELEPELASTAPPGQGADLFILSPAEAHEQTLAEYFQLTLDRTIEAAAELITRLGDWFDRTAELGRDTFDRYLGDESSGYQREREQGW